ncbi:MAG TPA: MerR family transcriptional regulator [Limnochordia bacterium]|nr:MerR family transcriptional regulator [Bacillota bacterium]HKM43706.1 MerR family transcriptional regulator [Limnochordia bacterium]
MEYTVKQLADLAGVSGRTLRYYDQIDLLKPAWTNEAGYRIYGSKEVDRLQQILFFRELGVDLGTIKEILESPHFQEEQALREHREQLLQKREQLDLLIQNVEQTLVALEGGRPMTDQEKFIGFKETLIKENEEKYGKEIREKYGDKTVDASNAKLMGLTQEQYAEMQKLAEEIVESLAKAVGKEDPSGEEGQRIAELHRKWLSFTWKDYSKEAHAGLAEMYLADERFTAYYDQYKEGAAQFLRDAIVAYTKSL